MTQADTPVDRPSSRPRLYTIAPSRPFLTTLARALLHGQIIPGYRPINDPIRLAEATILVPTRRAARALRQTFLAELGGRAAILPRIKPLGDIDEDALLIADDSPGSFADLAPELGATERLLGMTRLVLGWSQSVAAALFNPVTGASPTLPTSPAEAVHLARALLALLDQIETEGGDWSRLPDLVPDDHAAYWALTLSFVDIVSKTWPAFLAERGLEDPARRRNAMIRRETDRLRIAREAGPVIAAGSTGSIPATAELLDVVARLPQGAVVLPGLDLTLDDDAWAAIGAPGDETSPPVPGHPQYGLKLLLSRLRAGRDGVDELDPEPSAVLRLRTAALGEALKPAPTTETWRDFGPGVGGEAALAEAFAGVDLIEARSEPEEALAIAVALRGALETPEARAALVTPDRGLARRVAGELKRWGLAVDDSAGTPLADTPPTVLARLTADVALGGFDPVALVSLMAHPLAAFGLARPAARAAGRAREIACLRGPRPERGSDGLRRAFEDARGAHEAGIAHQPRARRRFSTADWEAAEDLLERIVAALGPLEAMAARSDPISLHDLATAHVAALRAVGLDEDGSDARLFAEAAGEALARFLAGLLEASRSPDIAIALAPSDYPAFFTVLLGHQPVRGRSGGEGRIAIWGPLEARLQSVDLLVLAGLNEGTWPATTLADPWLSRPMKRDLALEPPERRIGLAAHDFAEGAAKPRVVLSRSMRSGGAPTVPSRWLQRLVAVLGATVGDALRSRGALLIELARGLDRPAGEKPRPIARPEPRPPIETRPARLSVTEIETWIRDPYALYARHILKLDPLEPIAAAPDAGDRGSIVHDIVHAFLADWRDEPVTEAIARFISIVDEKLEAFVAFPEVVALFRPKLARIGAWFIAETAATAPDVQSFALERRGEWVLPLPGGDFVLSGRADRIDQLKDGRLAIIDYKTSVPPTAKQVQALLAPQLPLEAAIAKIGGFGPELAGMPIGSLIYMHLSGSGDGGKKFDVTKRKLTEAPLTGDDLADAAREKLIGLAAHYRNPKTGYPSRPRIQFSRITNGDYDHLARVKEWAAGEAGEE